MLDTDYLKSIIEPIVDHPDDLVIEKRDDEKGTLLRIYVSSSDVARLVGKKGITVDSIRLLMHIFGFKIGKQISLVINTK